MKRVIGCILVVAGAVCLYLAARTPGAECAAGCSWFYTLLGIVGAVIAAPFALVFLFILSFCLLAGYYFFLARRRGCVFRRTQATPEPLSDAMIAIVGPAPDTTPEAIAAHVYPKNNAGQKPRTIGNGEPQ